MTVVPAHGTRLARALSTCLAIGLLLAGCHSGNIPPPGTPVVTLTDSNGRFSSYVVAIDSITVTANDGGIASLLSNIESVDLARVSELTEMLGAPAAASGTYLSAQITLDFTAASIVYNNNGVALACSPQAPGGAALSIVTINVTFDPQHPLVITQGQSTRFAIDVDLAASNTVNTAASPCVVTVQPYLTARPAAVDSTVMRSRGLLVVTQPAQNNFIMNTRPLYDLVSIGMGAVTVEVSPQTYWNINGVTYTGTAGIPVLGQQGLNAPIAAYGTLGNLSGITPTFNASSVYVGTSLESPLQDYISGVVAARSGDTLTLQGGLFISRLGVPTFETTTAATLGTGTLISEDGVAASNLTAASVSVGQKLTLAGQGSLDTKGNLVMDATSGQVRLAPTRVWGTVNTATTGSLSLDAQTFSDYAASALSFTGTATGGGAVSSAAYPVNTGSLDVTGLGAGELVAVDGIVAPFGTAPPAFNATAVTAGAATTQELVVEWPGGTSAPFSDLTDSGFVVNLANPDLSTIHYILTGPDTLELKTLPASPFITSNGAPDQSALQLSVGSTALTAGISMFSTLSTYAAHLVSTLGSNKAYRLVAQGQYNSTTNTFVASSISLALHE